MEVVLDDLQLTVDDGGVEVWSPVQPKDSPDVVTHPSSIHVAPSAAVDVVPIRRYWYTVSARRFATQDLELVAQHQDLDLLGPLLRRKSRRSASTRRTAR
jgi:hypothetical protein